MKRHHKIPEGAIRRKSELVDIFNQYQVDGESKVVYKVFRPEFDAAPGGIHTFIFDESITSEADKIGSTIGLYSNSSVYGIRFKFTCFEDNTHGNCWIFRNYFNAYAYNLTKALRIKDDQ